MKCHCALIVYSSTPLLGTPLFDEFRRLPAQRFPYSVIYRIDNESIFILAIAHSSRGPGYWRHRK